MQKEEKYAITGEARHPHEDCVQYQSMLRGESQDYSCPQSGLPKGKKPALAVSPLVAMLKAKSHV